VAPDDPPDERDEPESEGEEQAPGGDEEQIPDSPLTGPAEWSVALDDDDEAALIFSGERVGQGRLNAGLAASLIQHIAGFVKPITGIAPDFTAITSLASTALHFGPGYGEAYQMTDAGELTNRLREAFEKLVRLIELTEDDQALLNESRETPAHSTTNYVHLLEVISENNLTATVVVRDRKTYPRVPPHRASVAKAILERRAPDRYETKPIKGYLYEANAKKRGFELETEEGGRVEGTYLPELDDKIGSAWNKIARVEIRMKWSRLERSPKETLDDVILLDVLEILRDEPPRAPTLDAE
jgi:hypothetical protein